MRHDTDCEHGRLRGNCPICAAVGPTGDFFPAALVVEAGLISAISQENGCVRIDFAKPTAWIALDTDLAFEFAMAIIRHATALMRADT